MKKQYSFSSKLKSYTGVASLLVMAGNTASAQNIIYTDISPDRVLENNSYQLDLNNDGTPDFRITHGTSSSDPDNRAVFLSMFNSNSVVNQKVGILSYSFYSPKAFNQGDTIKAGLDWFNGINGSSSSTFNILAAFSEAYGFGVGNFYNAGEKFMGLRFKANSKTYYGWMRVKVEGKTDSIILMEYAYNTEGSKPIAAGDGLTGIAAAKAPVKDIFALSKNNGKVTVHLKDPSVLGGSLKVVNIQGQEMRSLVITENETILNLDGLSSGMYFISVEKNGKQQARKLVINRPH